MRLVMLTATVLTISMTSALLPRAGYAQTLSAAASEEYGPYLVGPDGRPVYAFLSSTAMGGDGEDPINSCNVEDCRQNWPLVKVEGEVSVGNNLQPELVETKEVKGETVLLYGDHPLFHFFRDVPGAPPQGHGIYSFGGYWALVTPFGHAIRTGPMEEKDDYIVAPDEG